MKLLRQRNIPILGAVVDSLYTSLPILSIINFLSITTILYATLKEYLLPWVPWITLGWFLTFLVVITTTTMIFIYLFVLPSIWTFRNKQMNMFKSDLLDEVKELRKEIQQLKGGTNA
jgi:hypothetical protein